MTIGMPGIGGSLGQCQVCGEPFTREVVMGESVQVGRIPGFDEDIAVHTKCVEVLQSGCEWTELPDGPLRKVFAEHFAD